MFLSENLDSCLFVGRCVFVFVLRERQTHLYVFVGSGVEYDSHMKSLIDFYVSC